MKRNIFILVLSLGLNQLSAQFAKESSIDISIGYGLSAPYDDINIVDSGFYLQGEYVLQLTKWFALRPYAGLILTNSDGDNTSQNTLINVATSKAFLVGGKVRLTAPIPWVAPYLEGGIGASMGSFRTRTPFTDIDKSGLIPHFPFTIGLELGPNHNFDFAFTYYFQPNVEQFAGAAAIGISIPLKR